jgi:hypothetical protein
MRHQESVHFLNRHHAALWIFTGMIMINLLGLFVAEFFQRPVSSVREINQYRILFKGDELKLTNKITLTNKLGTYEFTKDNDQTFPWKITLPRKMIASQAPIQSMLQTLESIRIRKIHDYDPINASNFSLENPLTEIKLEFEDKNHKPLSISFGLTNPIDGSSYLYIPQNNAIYHVDALENKFENMDLIQLVEAKAFLFNPNRILSFSLSRVNKGQNNRPLLQIVRKEKEWVDQYDSPLIAERVVELFKEFSNIRSPIILDHLDDEQRKTEVAEYQQNPIFVVEFKDVDENVSRYYVSDLINHQWQDLKVERRQWFFVFPEGKTFQYLLPKDMQKFFNFNTSYLKAPNIKKIFY